MPLFAGFSGGRVRLPQTEQVETQPLAIGTVGRNWLDGPLLPECRDCPEALKKVTGEGCDGRCVRVVSSDVYEATVGPLRARYRGRGYVRVAVLDEKLRPSQLSSGATRVRRRQERVIGYTYVRRRDFAGYTEGPTFEVKPHGRRRLPVPEGRGWTDEKFGRGHYPRRHYPWKGGPPTPRLGELILENTSSGWLLCAVTAVCTSRGWLL